MPELDSIELLTSNAPVENDLQDSLTVIPLPEVPTLPPGPIKQLIHVLLPLELWFVIIGHLNKNTLNELAFLWLSVRRVAKPFQAEVERIFSKERFLGSRLDGSCGEYNHLLKT